MELQDIEQHMGISTSVCENVCRLLKCMVTATATRMGLGNHACSKVCIFIIIKLEFLRKFSNFSRLNVPSVKRQ